MIFVILQISLISSAALGFPLRSADVFCSTQHRGSRNLTLHLWVRLQLQVTECTCSVAACPREGLGGRPRSPAASSAPCTSSCASSTPISGTRRSSRTRVCTEDPPFPERARLELRSKRRRFCRQRGRKYHTGECSRFACPKKNLQHHQGQTSLSNGGKVHP